MFNPLHENVYYIEVYLVTQKHVDALKAARQIIERRESNYVCSALDKAYHFYGFQRFIVEDIKKTIMLMLNPYSYLDEYVHYKFRNVVRRRIELRLEWLDDCLIPLYERLAEKDDYRFSSFKRFENPMLRWTPKFLTRPTLPTFKVDF